MDKGERERNHYVSPYDAQGASPVSTTETPMQQTANVLAAPDTVPRDSHDLLEAPNRIEVPAAFCRDEIGPPPPPDDPHWREWPPYHDGEPVPRLLLIGVPVAMGVLGVFHILLILIVLRASGL
jgi:hypothetical protein